MLLKLNFWKVGNDNIDVWILNKGRLANTVSLEH
jgi:hypothetical protein